MTEKKPELTKINSESVTEVDSSYHSGINTSSSETVYFALGFTSQAAPRAVLNYLHTHEARKRQIFHEMPQESKYNVLQEKVVFTNLFPLF